MGVLSDPITMVNLLLSVMIFAFGYWGYKKGKSDVAFYVGAAFGLFGISHFVTLLGYGYMMEPALIWIRAFGYMMVAYALYEVSLKKKR